MRDPEILLPLTHLSHHIMLSLQEGASHGYAISKRVHELSRGRISPGTGTFYSALKRMLDEGVLEEADAPVDADSSDTRRRYYALTPFGRDVLAAERTRLKELLAENSGGARVTP